jgi:hypothetical protein
MNQMQTPVRLAVIDSDSGFVRVLEKRLEAMGWQYRTLDRVRGSTSSAWARGSRDSA